MDLEAPFKTETLRPLATLFLPGAVAIAPYVLVSIHFFAAIEDFARTNTGIYVVLLAMAALAVGFVLEDLGARLESLVWDRLVEKETGVHSDDWYAFLNLITQGDKVGHRYLRTITMHLKFELAFGLALIVGWFGMLWLDSVVFLWSYDATIAFSFVVLCLASYVLWESYSSVWVLARTRHLIVHGVACTLQPRDEDPRWIRRIYDWFLIVSAVASVASGLVLVTIAIASDREIGRDSGLFTAVVTMCFGVVLMLTWWWFLTETEANGRRRGVALRFSFAYALLAALAHVRYVFADPPFIRSVFWVSMVLAALHLVGAHVLWRGARKVPEKHSELPPPIPDAT